VSAFLTAMSNSVDKKKVRNQRGGGGLTLKETSASKFVDSTQWTLWRNVLHFILLAF